MLYNGICETSIFFKTVSENVNVSTLFAALVNKPKEKKHDKEP